MHGQQNIKFCINVFRVIMTVNNQ